MPSVTREPRPVALQVHPVEETLLARLPEPPVMTRSVSGVWTIVNSWTSRLPDSSTRTTPGREEEAAEDQLPPVIVFRAGKMSSSSAAASSFVHRNPR